MSARAASEQDGVLGEQREQRRVAGGGLREDQRDPVEALEHRGPAGVAADLRPHPGPLLARQDRHDLELRAVRRQHAPALRCGLDLARGTGEHRDDAVVVASAGTALRRTSGAVSAP